MTIRTVSGLLISFFICACTTKDSPGSIASSHGALIEAAASLASPAAPVSDSFFGYNANVSSGPGWSGTGGAPATPTFLGSVAALRPQLLRYPGGTIANYWNWRTGLVYSDWPENSAALDTPNTLEDLAAAIASLRTSGVDVTPVFTVNMMTSGDFVSGGPFCVDADISTACLDDQVAMLHHAQDVGLRIKYVELGNEFYLANKPDYDVRWSDATEYALEARRWVSRLHAEFSGVQVGVVGFARDDEMGTGATREVEWNQRVHDAFDGAPANESPEGFILHFYAGTGLRQLHGYGACTDATCTQAAFDSVGGVVAMMAPPFTVRSYYDTVASKIPSGAVPWSTEYNLADRTLVTAGTWAHGLYLSLENGFFSERSGISLVHNISGAAGRFSLIFRDADQFALFTGAPTTPTYGLSAAGYASSLFARAVQGATMRAPLAFSPNPTRGLTDTTQYPALTGWVFYEASGVRRVFLINVSEEMAQIDLNSVLRGTVHSVVMHAEPHVRIVNAGDLSIDEHDSGPTLALSPYAIAMVEEVVEVDAGTDAGVDAALDAAQSTDGAAGVDASSTDADLETDAAVGDAALVPSASASCDCHVASGTRRSWSEWLTALLGIAVFVRRMRTRAQFRAPARG